MLIKIIGMSAVYVVLVIFGQLYYKRAASQLETETARSFCSSLLINSNLYIATAFYVAAMVLWVWLLKYTPLSKIFPIMSAFLLIAIPLASQHFLEEVLSLRYWGGVVLIMGGIALIATEMAMVEG